MDAAEVTSKLTDSEVLMVVIEDISNDGANLCEVQVEEASEECQMEVEECNLNQVNVSNREELTEPPNTDYCLQSVQDGQNDTSVITSETCLKERKCLDELFQSKDSDNNELKSENTTIEVSRCESVNNKNIEAVSKSESVNNENVEAVSRSESVNNENIETIIGSELTQPLEYVFGNARYITEAWTDFSYIREGDCFLKGCKWSPDGTCLLSNSEDKILRIFELPLTMYNRRTFHDSMLSLNELNSVLRIKEGGLIYDYCWYPLMSSPNPNSCRVLSSSLGSPLHLWDAFTGNLQATYLPYNHVEEVVSALSLAFNISGTRIYSGFNHSVKIFNTDIPGRDCDTISTKADQPGIVSCIAVSPAMEGVFAIGTFRRTVGLYTNDGDTVCILKGQIGGLTHLMFSPDGNLLYTGARKDNEILCWDLRNTTDVLFTLNRVVTTNQRIYFDITQDGKYLLSGSTDGIIRVWDISNARCVSQETIPPVVQWTAHNDCANGVSIHKQIPLVATASGQRHVSEIIDDDEDEDDDRILIRKPGKENMIKLWWCGPIKNSESGTM